MNFEKLLCLQSWSYYYSNKLSSFNVSMLKDSAGILKYLTNLGI